MAQDVAAVVYLPMVTFREAGSFEITSTYVLQIGGGFCHQTEQLCMLVFTFPRLTIFLGRVLFLKCGCFTRCRMTNHSRTIITMVPAYVLHHSLTSMRVGSIMVADAKPCGYFTTAPV